MSYLPFPHSFGAYENTDLIKGFHEEEDLVTKSMDLPMFAVENYEESNFYGSCLENMSGQGISQLDNLQQTISDYRTQSDIDPSLQSIYDILEENQVEFAVPDFQESIKEKLNDFILEENQVEFAVPDFHESIKEKLNDFNVISMTSQGFLGNHQSGANTLVDGNLRNNDTEEIRKLSTEELMRLAAEKYIQFSSNKVNGYTMFIHPYGSSPFSSLSMDETREVELAYQLLTAAEKAGRKQYDLANKLLTRCEWVASDEGSPVERLVFYFAEALRKRIEKETGIIMPKRVKEQVRSNEVFLELGSTATFMTCHQELPFSQVLQFTGIQTIIDHVTKAKKIHLIDFNIGKGVQWTALMQALVEQKSSIQLLKITVIGTRDKHKIEETGKRLQSFVESLNLPFSFKLIFLLDMKELKEEDFNIEADEVVAVYLHLVLRTMIPRPDQLEHLMGVLKKIKPSVVVVAEVEANHNSTSFVNRFTEALFYYSVFFDCLETCLAKYQEHRMTLEGFYLAAGIKNIVSTEGEERTTRNVKINVWRSFFARFGMVEVGLSESSLYQANLVSKKFSCGSSCTLANNGKCLLVGWKGTPLLSLSAWKFT